eukprot:TRINITY_DN8081_c0_g1_i1.p1 TRINITY_DN8081_c0_g1~~TRINITY_DN8081_c0_g1_i1.p1  ORF type:complete len:146 (-),score=50.57 TRINITY_DN8081_c0_g1_i1:154-558(-)
MIDSAMMRPGRLDKPLFVPLPSAASRYSILRTLTRKSPLHPSVDLNEIASNPSCEGMSGADLDHLVREASTTALHEYFQQKEVNQDMTSADIFLHPHHFHLAFKKVFPSVSLKEAQIYEDMKRTLQSSHVKRVE